MYKETNPYKHSKWSLVWGLLAIASCLVVMPAHAKVIKVDGKNDGAIDRAAIQAAIDSAPSKSVIQLRGTFQLDGTTVEVNRSDLTLVGVGSDTQLLGLVGNDGLPENGFAYNDGIAILPSGLQPVENIQIKNLAFSGFSVAVLALGGEASLNNIDIKNLRMTNNWFGILATGSVNDLQVSNNRIMGSIAGGIFVDEGPLTNALITGNRVVSADLSVLPFALEIGGPAQDVEVSGNIFQGGSYAVGLFGEASNAVLTDNWILDGGTQGAFEFARGGGILVGVDGLGFVSPASGYTIMNNQYANNVASLTLGDGTLVPRDIWLFSNSSDNEITESDGTVVLDNGVDNTVILIP